MIKSIWPFSNKPSKASLERQAEFTNLMELAQDVAARDPRGLLDLVRLYTRPIQTELLLSCAKSPPHGGKADIAPHQLFMPRVPLVLTSHSHYPQLDETQFEVDLAKDPILPGPWYRERYAKALSEVGSGKKSGAWEQDRNHSVAAILPWGIACVFGGNHSIAAGILAGEGVVTPCEAWDMSGLLAKVRCDGIHYVEIETGKPICKMHDPKMGAVFEIGRLLEQHQIKPLRRL